MEVHVLRVRIYLEILASYREQNLAHLQSICYNSSSRSPCLLPQYQTSVTTIFDLQKYKYKDPVSDVGKFFDA